MLTVIGCMIAGMLAGYAARRLRLGKISHLITALIWVLLFLLGWEVGHNQQVMVSLSTLGGEALLLTLAALLGSCLAAWVVWKRCNRNSGTIKKEEEQ